MMDLEHDLVFAYLEEDNIQRAYFRVLPLLTLHGSVQEEAVRLWPDEGCLRIVPDRAEQHTFKDRMRSLGHYCAIDLRGISADAGKIRTNKNYRPERGEINQYILYSDTVKPLPEHTFFEVVEGQPADFAALADKALTPRFFIHQVDTLFGPVSKAQPTEPVPAAEAAATLYPLTTPDGVARLMLCMPSPDEIPAPAAPVMAPVRAAVPAPAPVQRKDPPADVPLPIGRHLEILDSTKSHDETLQDLAQPLSQSANLLHAPKPAAPASEYRPQRMPGGSLSGTPLVRTQFKTSVPQPKNKLQEVVSNQWRVARYEPPTDSLPVGTTMRQVDNPVENACQSLRSAWQMPEAQNQLVDCVLSLDGMQQKLEPRMMPAGSQSPLQKALVRHLEDLEAERLTALIQLDKAKADVETFRKTALDALSDKTRAECTRLTQQKEAHEKSIAQMKDHLTALCAQRDELLARIDDLQQSVQPAALAKAAMDAQISIPLPGVPLRMSPVTGVQADARELIRRIMTVVDASANALSRNEAIALLALLAVSPRIGLSSTAPAAAATLLHNVAAAMGWLGSYAQQVTAEQKPMLTAAPADATPALLLTALPNYAPLPAVTKLLLARATTHLVRNAAYDVDPWPILPLNPGVTVAEMPAADVAPISAASLEALFDNTTVTSEEIDRVLADVFAAFTPLSGKASAEMHRFIIACAALMDGGFAAACDWAILLWLIPALERSQRPAAQLHALLQEYPLSLSRL